MMENKLIGSQGGEGKSEGEERCGATYICGRGSCKGNDEQVNIRWEILTYVYGMQKQNFWIWKPVWAEGKNWELEADLLILV